MPSAADPAIHSLRFIMLRLYHQHVPEAIRSSAERTILRRHPSERYNTDSMTEQVSPAHGVHGVVTVPGDKSISHRYAMLTSIAEGDSEIYNYSTGADCHSTLSCMQALGRRTLRSANEDGRNVLIVHGKGIKRSRRSAAHA